MDAQAFRDRTLGAKQRRRLGQSEWFEDLMLLCGIDHRARQPGFDVCEVDEAIEHLRAMNEELND